MTLKLSKSDLLGLLRNHGYSINIEIIDNSKRVSFVGKHSLHPQKISHSYSLEFTNREIELCVVDDLLKWTGLKPKIVLDY